MGETVKPRTYQLATNFYFSDNGGLNNLKKLKNECTKNLTHTNKVIQIATGFGFDVIGPKLQELKHVKDSE